MGHFSTYGMGGGCAALCAFVSWFMVQNRGCTNTVAGLFGEHEISFENLQIIHYVAIVIGLVLFVLSCFNFAGVLYEVQPLFYAAALVLFAAAVMMAYAAAMAFKLVCQARAGGYAISFKANVFDAEDYQGIAIVALDILSSLLFLGAGINFSRF